MNLNLRKNIDSEEIADFVSSTINKELKLGKKVLWFVSGGSVMLTEVQIAQKIKKFKKGNLVITLADERYGVVGHPDSNWASLLNMGFDLPLARLIPVLNGKNMEETTVDFRNILKAELNIADYKIGVFGIGLDGHTAGILPGSVALNENELAMSYMTLEYNRITITPKTICLLNEAVLYAKGESKLPVVKELEKDIIVSNQPAQILKKVPLLTIFTN